LTNERIHDKRRGKDASGIQRSDKEITGISTKDLVAEAL